MKKLQTPFVAMALLCLKDDQHSDDIARAIADSDLTELGYKGETPERTLNSQLRNSKRYAKHFTHGTYQAHFRLADRDHVLAESEVRLALLALSRQRPLHELRTLGMVEFTFIGSELAGVRNVQALRSTDSPPIRKVLLPEEISREELDQELPNRVDGSD